MAVKHSVTIRVSDEELARIDKVVACTRLSSRSEALRAGAVLLFREARRAAIVDSVRATYGPPDSQPEAEGAAAWEAILDERR